MNAVADEIEKLLVMITRTMAPATAKAYRLDIAHFERWCDAQGHATWSEDPEIFLAYLQSLSTDYKFATVCRKRFVLQSLYRRLRRDEFLESPSLHYGWRAISRGAVKGQEQAYALGKKDIARIEKVLSSDTLRGAYFRLLINFMYDTACRGSEVVAAEFADVERLSSTHGVFQIRRSKTDQYGFGQRAVVSSKTLKLLEAWKNRSGLSSGVIFPLLDIHELTDTPLRVDQLTEIVRSLVELAGYATEVVVQVSSHSFRIGAAQDMEADGKSITLIMKRGRWRSLKTLMKYLRSADLRDLL